MSELENEIDVCAAKLCDASLPLHRRVVESLMALQGLDLSGMSAPARAEIESSMLYLNVILKRYKIATFDDYKNIEKRDLKKISQRLLQMCLNIKGLSKNV